MKRLLLIVDPQIDFISGTLPVPGAAAAMESLAEYILHSDGDYAAKVVTVDSHPYNHCSFTSQGGKWPLHCVQHTVGAAIFPALVDSLYTTAGAVHVLPKGNYAATEEYSIFKNAESCGRLKELVDEFAADSIDICGIAGDVCVLDTLKDGLQIYGAAMFRVLQEYCPSLDGGVALREEASRL